MAKDAAINKQSKSYKKRGRGARFLYEVQDEHCDSSLAAWMLTTLLYNRAEPWLEPGMLSAITSACRTVSSAFLEPTQKHMQKRGERMSLKLKRKT